MFEAATAAETLKLGRFAAAGRVQGEEEAAWTVASLAAGVHVSRSVFSELFTALVGVPPLLHLTRWRMHLATRWLRDERASLGQVASRLEYEPSSPEIGFATPSSGDAQRRTG